MRLPFAASAASLAAALLATGCQSLQSSDSLLGIITPYRVEIVQGNVVSKEQLDLVKPGMNRAQVRDVLGSPLLTDPFHSDRWDYVFTIRRQGAPRQAHRITLVFANDKLEKIDSDGPLPSDREFVASIDTFKTARNAPPLALTEAQLKALPAPAKLEAPAAEASAPSRSYPPLEPVAGGQ